MIALLSPSKTLDESPIAFGKYTHPRLLEQSGALVQLLKKKSPKEIEELMSISPQLAEQNYRRYATFQPSFDPAREKPAVLLFKGDVYSGLSAENWKEEDLSFAQLHLRILSGLYGLLRPLDLIRPYRLEMKTRLANPAGKDLYAFWGDQITQLLNADLAETEEGEVINLASKEYFKALQPSGLQAKVIEVQFKERRAGVYKVIPFHAKKARGLMAGYLVRNRLTQARQLLEFEEEDYGFNESLSDDHTWVFTR